MKTLIVAPAWVGDMVMAHALVQILDGEIHMLAPAATTPLARRMPRVASGIEFPLGHGELKIADRWRLGRRLSKERFDRAIVLPNSLKSAITPAAAGIPCRTGWHGEARFGLLNDRRRLDRERLPLMIERFMALGRPADAELPRPYPEPRLETDPENLAAVRARLNLESDRPALALCPGAEYGPAKQWPAEHFAAVAGHALNAGWQVWLLGSPGDAEVCGQIAAAVPNIDNLAGQTRLVDAVDLLGAADRVVCNDSGLMHVACAVGTRVVAVYGSTSPGFTPPLDPGAVVVKLDLDCSPCFERTCPLGHLNCLHKLAPKQVVDVLQLGCG